MRIVGEKKQNRRWEAIIHELGANPINSNSEDSTSQLCLYRSPVEEGQGMKTLQSRQLGLCGIQQDQHGTPFDERIGVQETFISSSNVNDVYFHFWKLGPQAHYTSHTPPV